MKKSLILFFLMFFGVCFSQSLKDLYGKWTGFDEQNKRGSFTFFSDGYTYVEFEGMIIDGRNYIIPDGPNKGKVGHVNYTVDFSKTPFKFTLTASYNGQNNEIEESKFLKGLIEFINENEIRLFIDFDNKNPSIIDPLSPGTMILHKDSNL